MIMSTPAYLVSNGDYWQVAWVDTNGIRHRQSLGSKAQIGGKRAAQKLVDSIRDEHARTPGMESIIGVPTLEQWATEWPAVRHELKPGTLACYRQTFNRLRQRFGGPRKLDAITPTDAVGFRRWLSNSAGDRPGCDEISTATVNRIIRDCKSIWATAVKMRRVAFNPWLGVPSSTSIVTEARYVPVSESRRAWEVMPTPWRRLVALARLAGLRRGEAIRLRWVDIDNAQRVMTVHPEMHQGSIVEGTKQRKRPVPICPELWDILQSGERGERVCDLPKCNIDRQFGKMLRRAGAADWGKPLHTLRKSLATDWCQRCDGKDLDLARVAQWLGHSVDVLLRHYHLDIPGAASAITGMGRRDTAIVVRP